MAPPRSMGKHLSSHAWHAQKPYPRDCIHIRNVSATVHGGLDAWHRQRPQPALISVIVALENKLSPAAEGDQLDRSTINYSTLTKTLLAALSPLPSHPSSSPSPWPSSESLTLLLETATLQCASSPDVISSLEISLSYPKASLHQAVVGHRYCKCYESGNYSRELFIEGLMLGAVIGVHEHERQARQSVVASVWVDKLEKGASDEYGAVEGIVSKAINDSSFLTLEALASHVCGKLKPFISLASLQSNLRVKLEKPAAIATVEAPGVEVFRTSQDLAKMGVGRRTSPKPEKGGEKEEEEQMES